MLIRHRQSVLITDTRTGRLHALKHCFYYLWMTRCTTWTHITMHLPCPLGIHTPLALLISQHPPEKTQRNVKKIIRTLVKTYSTKPQECCETCHHHETWYLCLAWASEGLCQIWRKSDTRGHYYQVICRKQPLHYTSFGFLISPRIEIRTWRGGHAWSWSTGSASRSVDGGRLSATEVAWLGGARGGLDPVHNCLQF